MEVAGQCLHRRDRTLSIVDLDLLYAGIYGSRCTGHGAKCLPYFLYAHALHQRVEEISRCIFGLLQQRSKFQPRNVVKRIHLQVLRDTAECLSDPTEFPKDAGP